MRHLFRAFPVAAAVSALLVAPLAAAAGVPTITLRTSRLAILNDGRDTAEIIAEVRESSGAYARDGTMVNFTTTLGTFAQSGKSASAATRAGTARVRLSGQEKGSTTITATVAGGGFQTCVLMLTDDPAETYQGNTYVVVQGNASLVYAAEERIIRATGRTREEGSPDLPGAYLSFRNIEISADLLEVSCSRNAVKASGEVVLRRGGRRLVCGRLYLDLFTGQGYAITEVEGRLRPVAVAPDLGTSPLEGGLAPMYLEMQDLSAAKLIVTARQVLYFPGDKLQFKRPRFYQEGVQIFNMPFYSLSLYSNQLFTDQLVTVGTTGLGVDIPFYYDMSAVSTGVLRTRYGERLGHSVYSTRPGLMLDLVQTYNSSGMNRRYTGQISLTGINRSDWGLNWMHSQEFAGDLRSSIYLDMPQHRSVFGSTTLTKRMGTLNLGLNLSANRSISGFQSSGTQADAYVETTPRNLGRTGYSLAFGATAGMSRSKIGDYAFNGSSQGVHARMFSQPFRMDRDTTLSNNISFGHTWTTQGRSGVFLDTSLMASRSLGPGSSLQAIYSFTQRPTFLAFGGRHRLSVGLTAGAPNKWTLFLNGNAMLDTNNLGLFGEFSYTFLPRWRFSLGANLQQFGTATYRDFEFTLGRTVGGRDLSLYYSTFSHRFYFDIQASRF